MSVNDISQQDLELNYDLYFNKIYKFFFYKILSKETAEDLTSETFIVYATILRSNKTIDNQQAFLFGIAKNIFVKYLKQKYRQEIAFSNISDDFYEYVDNFIEKIETKKDLNGLILKYLDQIPEKQSIILRMRLIDKLTLNEICNKINKDMNYVKTTQKRGLKSLKDIVARNL